MPHTPPQSPVSKNAVASQTDISIVVVEDKSIQVTKSEKDRTRLTTLFGFTPAITRRCPADSIKLGHVHVIDQANPSIQGEYYNNEEGLDIFCQLFSSQDERVANTLSLLAFINVMQMSALMQRDQNKTTEEDDSRSLSPS